MKLITLTLILCSGLWLAGCSVIVGDRASCGSGHGFCPAGHRCVDDQCVADVDGGDADADGDGDTDADADVSPDGRPDGDTDCGDGFEWDGVTCVDIDECSDETDTCDPLYATCTNVDGGFTCACNEGFDDVRGDGSQCTCGEGWTICDALCVDMESDLEHCGHCNEACAPEHATGLCSGGDCQIQECDDRYYDCDGEVDNGCESIFPCESWVLGFGLEEVDEANAVATDDDGTIYVVGDYRGGVDFGEGALPARGENEIFVASFEPTGALRWAKGFGGTGADRADDLAVDGDGHVIVVGSFSNTVNFGGDDLISNELSEDVFVVSLDTDGNHLWSKRFGSVDDDAAIGVDTDAANNVYVAGGFNGEMSIEDEPVDYVSGADIFVVSYDSGGSLRWAFSLGSTSGEAASDIAVHTDGTFYMTGQFRGTLVFPTGPLVCDGDSGDIFIASYDTDGVFRWAAGYGAHGGVLGDVPLGIAVGGGGNIFLTGSYDAAFDFGGEMLDFNAGADLFVASLSTLALHRWSNGYGGISVDIGGDIVINDAGDVLVGGSFGDTLNLGGRDLESEGSSDIFVASFDALGGHNWSEDFGGMELDQATAVAPAGADGVVVAGTFRDTVDFDDIDVLRSEGEDDAFLMYYRHVE